MQNKLEVKRENLDQILNILKEIIANAGIIAKKYFGKILEDELIFKGEKDIVTKADLEIENYIKKNISDKLSNFEFIAEESSKSIEILENKNYFVIDPLDGTTNFAHNIHFHAISIGLIINGKIELGIINLPQLNEIFSAINGKGAFLNDKRITVSKTDKLINSIVITGFADIRANYAKNTLEIFKNLATNVRGIRRTGSAVTDMCFVACKRADAFYEYGLKPWDVVAGTIIVKEAGGMVTDFEGTFNFIKNEKIVASNGKIHKQILGYIKKYF